jgi:hypothetical protein
MEKFQALYNHNLSSIKASEGLATILNQQRNPKLKTGLSYEEGSSSDKPRNEEPIKFVKSQPMTTTNLQKQRKTISHPRRVKKKVLGLNL